MAGHYDDGYSHEVPVTPSHDGEQQFLSTAQCKADGCTWTGLEHHGGQGAWDEANNEGYQHVSSTHADYGSSHNDAGFHVFTQDPS